VKEITVKEAASISGVTPANLRRWAETGVIPQWAGRWTASAAAHARIVRRLRERGHSLQEIRVAGQTGRLAFGYIEDLFSPATGQHSLEHAASETGLEEALIERILRALGFAGGEVEHVTDEDLELLRYVASVLEAGFPLVALLQLVRVYGQAMAQIADTEIRLFHLYVHEPLMHDGVPGLEMAEEMNDLARELLPLASPIMERVHEHFLRHFVGQDVIGHMESDLGEDGAGLGRLKVAIAFADIAGYTRLTEEEGEASAVDAVERFVETVENTLPDDARVVKTIGDEVMVVGSDPGALVDWAVGFQTLQTERPWPRIGVHHGSALFRDGDYYGREINIAARVVARAAGGEVLVTRPVVEAAGPHLEFEPIGEVRLKGFRAPTELFVARQSEDDEA
jgi:adenylate cyclase